MFNSTVDPNRNVFLASYAGWQCATGSGVHDTGISMGPMGIPWEWEA